MDDVGAGLFQLLRFGVQRRGKVHHHLIGIFIMLVAALARHGERTWHRDLDGPVGIAAEKLDVAHFYRMSALNLRDDARHRTLAARRHGHNRRVMTVDAVELSNKAVRITLTTDLAVGHDVNTGPFHVADSKHCRVILRRFEMAFLDPP